MFVCFVLFINTKVTFSGKSSKKRERTSFQIPQDSSAAVSTPTTIIDASKGILH